MNKPLLASGSASSLPSGAMLTQDMVRPVMDAAIQHWAAAGMAPSQLNVLRNADVEIVDLDGALLGLAYSDWIALDRDAAGLGWSTYVGSAATSGVDLFSAIAHELGHLAGYEHSLDTHDVMAATLPASTRRLPLNMFLPETDRVALVTDQAQNDLQSVFDTRDLEDDTILPRRNDTLWPRPALVCDTAQLSQDGKFSAARFFSRFKNDEMDLLDDELLELLAVR